jgi:2'-5' RNA ligase
VVKLRLAAALLISDPPAAEINGLRRACSDGLLDRVDPHITLVEPINVSDGDVDEVHRILRDAAAESRPLTFTLGPAASFAPDSPVLYLAVEGDLGGLSALRSAVRTGPLGRDSVWPFVPHLTIGTDLSDARLAAAVEALADYTTTVALTHVHLLQEHRDPDEVRRWRPIADAALGGRSVSGRGGIELEITASTGTGFALTARRDGSVVGELTGWTDGSSLRVAWLRVEEAERGLGVGRRLLAELETWGRARGADRLVAAVAPTTSDFLGARGWRDADGVLVRDL